MMESSVDVVVVMAYGLLAVVVASSVVESADLVDAFVPSESILLW